MDSGHPLQGDNDANHPPPSRFHCIKTTGPSVANAVAELTKADTLITGSLC